MTVKPCSVLGLQAPGRLGDGGGVQAVLEVPVDAVEAVPVDDGRDGAHEGVQLGTRPDLQATVVPPPHRQEHATPVGVHLLDVRHEGRLRLHALREPHRSCAVPHGEGGHDQRVLLRHVARAAPTGSPSRASNPPRLGGAARRGLPAAPAAACRLARPVDPARTQPPSAPGQCQQGSHDPSGGVQTWSVAVLLAAGPHAAVPRSRRCLGGWMVRRRRDALTAVRGNGFSFPCGAPHVLQWAEHQHGRGKEPQSHAWNGTAVNMGLSPSSQRLAAAGRPVTWPGRWRGTSTGRSSRLGPLTTATRPVEPGDPWRPAGPRAEPQQQEHRAHPPQRHRQRDLLDVRAARRVRF